MNKFSVSKTRDGSLSWRDWLECGIIKQGDVICQEKHESGQKAEYIM